MTRNEEYQALLTELPVQVVDLPAVEQELALAVRVHVPDPSVGVRVDVDAVEPHLVAAHEAEGVRDLAGALAEALDLGSGENQAGLERLVDEVLVTGGSVARDGLLLRPSLSHRPPPPRRSRG